MFLHMPTLTFPMPQITTATQDTTNYVGVNGRYHKFFRLCSSKDNYISQMASYSQTPIFFLKALVNVITSVELVYCLSKVGTYNYTVPSFGSSWV